MVEWPFSSIITAWLATTIFLIIGQPFARRVGWVDRPDPRKIHTIETPLIGGLAMFSGFTLALLQLEIPWMPLEGIIEVGGACLILGYLDDVRNIRARTRFLIEFSIALWMVIGYGLEIHTLGNLFGFGEVTLGRWSVLFTTICIVGLINAINLSDGLDGLAGGQSVIAFLLMLILASLMGSWLDIWVLCLFVVILLTFLAFNAPLPWLKRESALVFMGDAGSMFLGLGLVWFSVRLTQGVTPAMSPVTAVWVLAVPLFDMFSSIVRRLAKGNKIFEPDREHMHHLFLNMGINKGMVCLLMMGLTTLFGVSGIAAWWLGVPDAVMFYLLVAIFFLYCWFAMVFCKRYIHCIDEAKVG